MTALAATGMEVIRVAVTARVDYETAEFAEIVCADPEWVAAEFEQIVSGLVIVPTSTAAPAPPSRGSRPWVRSVQLHGGDPWLHEIPERVRAPPSIAATRGEPIH